MTAEPACRTQMHIDASPMVVFRHFTEPTRMAAWMGIDHKLDATPGGEFVVDINGRNVVEGRFIEVDPPRRLVFTWGWRDSDGMPPGSTTVEVRLTPEGSGTLLDFTHNGVPAGETDRHTEGWNHYLPRLATAAVGRLPGPDTFGAEDGP